MTKLRKFSESIGHMEGFFVKSTLHKTLPQRLNNPGDLIYKQQKNSVKVNIKGSDGKIRSFASFDTEEDGWLACDEQLRKFANRGFTVWETIKAWAPTDDGNNPNGYTQVICKLMGCIPDNILRDVIKE